MKFSAQEYNSRIEALFTRFQSVQTSGFNSGTYKPGLGGMRRLDAALGHPSRALRCIHVAGTNGKGSVCSMLAAALSARGLKAGLYTSPHILDFRERIKVLGPDGSLALITREGVWEFLESYGGAFEGRSFFEITTGMAFWWFRREGVDAAVIETGLGGRLDSTNIIRPLVSVISSIGLDHCALLGDTVEKIAREKAGIFKGGVPAVVWGRDKESSKVFEHAAARKGCPLIFADSMYVTGKEEGILASMDLRGSVQNVNLHTSLAVLNVLGMDLDDGMAAALKSTASLSGLGCRWQKLADAPETICDLGHNPQALAVNFNQLRASGKKLVIVYGVMADKDLEAIIPLMPAEARYIFTAPGTARALKAESLYERVRAARPGLNAECVPGVAEAVRRARGTADPSSDLVFIGGSTFVVSEALESLRRQSDNLYL